MKHLGDFLLTVLSYGNDVGTNLHTSTHKKSPCFLYEITAHIMSMYSIPNFRLKVVKFPFDYQMNLNFFRLPRLAVIML